MKKAILMMTFGSPEEITFEGVADFFTNIRRGVRPQDHEIQTLYDNYVLIGGTPLQKITREEVTLVEARLGNEYSVYFANKFSRPFIPDVIGQMEADGIEQCICLILEPHYSFYSVMGYEKFLESKQIQFLVALDFGDPYIDQIFENSKLVAEKLSLSSEQYTNTWQSESDIGIPWIKPDVLEYLREQKEHPDHYIFVPISFISEHIEVLFDNDVECYDLCQEFGVNYHRPPMPNTDSRLIDALVNTVRANEDKEFKEFLPEEETFDELVPSDETKNILAESQDLQMPEFVKKLIEKKGRENVKMPYLIKKMLEKAGKLPKE